MEAQRALRPLLRRLRADMDRPVLENQGEGDGFYIVQSQDSRTEEGMYVANRIVRVLIGN